MSFSKSEENIIATILGRDIVVMYESFGDLFVVTRVPSITRVTTILYADTNLEFRVLIDAFAIDRLKQKNKFEIYYQLYSDKLKRRLFVIIEIGEHEFAPSLSVVFKNVTWYEREIFDMFGIMFAGHPDLRRILTSPMSDNFPLKKSS